MADLQSSGLSDREVDERRAEHGPNRISAPRTIRFLPILLEEVTEPMILLLLAVAVGYFLFGELREALAVLVIILGILFVEVWTEFRAKRSLNELSRLTEAETTVIRSEKRRSIPVEQVVPGDLLLLRGGSQVPADATVVQEADLAADESALTGESVPVEKEVDGHLYRGTTVIRGEALAVVTATGKQTRLGRLVSTTAKSRPPRTPLQLHMRSLAKVLAAVALGFAVLVPIISMIFSGMSWRQAVLNSLSLAFATIPEELPILITVVLGVGSLRLAKEHALVRDLRAAETLGHITAIVTDKTGTLTENRLQIATWLPAGSEEEADSPPLWEAAFLSLGVRSRSQREKTLVDPLEQALGSGLAERINSTILETATPIRIPFTRERNWSGARWTRATTAGAETALNAYVFIKGAPEAILDMADVQLGLDENVTPLTVEARARIEASVDRLAADGRRVLAVARGMARGSEAVPIWTYLGLIALEDPLRPDAFKSFAAVRNAGIQVFLATGDHPNLARAIGRSLGLESDALITGDELKEITDQELKDRLRHTRLFARISPEQKLRLVNVLQETGHVVAMTGDGSNDAPALKAADVGIAMGRDGTDAAREASSLVLTDDRFSTIATGVREGRGLFANLQKAVRYYLAVKVGLIGAMLLPSLGGAQAPFSPATIILLELFMDLAASTAFVIEPPEAPLMQVAPRPAHTPFLDADMRRGILGGGLLLAFSVLGLAWIVTLFRGGTPATFRTAALTAWLLGHVALAYRLRWWGPIEEKRWLANRVMNTWAIGAGITALAATYLAPVQSILKTEALPVPIWGLTAAGAALLMMIGGRMVQARVTPLAPQPKATGAKDAPHEMSPLH